MMGFSGPARPPYGRTVAFVLASTLLLVGGCASRNHGNAGGPPYAEPIGTIPRVVFFTDVSNFRDLGGWRGLNGRKVRQGRIYRSACLNDRWRWYQTDAARNFMCPETKRFIVEDLGVRTEIDLRKESNCRGMNGSPLGPGVGYFNVSSKAYEDLATPEGRDAFRRVFKIFLDESNYPVVFHCIGGKDRAGSVAFILNGLLGVSERDLRKDWEFSRYWHKDGDFSYERKLARLVEVFDAYPGGSLCERIEGYVLSLGFTREDIDCFRKLMLTP